MGYQATPQLSDYLGTGGNGFKVLYLFQSCIAKIIVVIKRNYLDTYFIHIDWKGTDLTKHDKNGIYFKSRNMNSPQTITHATHSADHVMDIVILTCGHFSSSPITFELIGLKRVGF